MSAITTVLFGLALLPAALFFGVAVYMVMAPCYDKLSGRSFTEFFQAVDPYMKVRAKWALLTQLAFTLPLLVFTAGWPFILVLGSLVMAVAMLVTAVRGNVPLNRQMDHWRPDDLPSGWERVRDRWLWLHSVRGVMATGAFVLLLIAALTHDGRTWWTARPAEAAVVAAPPRCCEATVYLPLADNAGQAFSAASWDRAVAMLVTPFGGGRLGDPFEGCWIDGHGRLIHERMRPVIISFRPEQLDQFRRAVQEVRELLGQEAMYVRFEEPRVEVVR